jgi:hypothetical protein
MDAGGGRLPADGDCGRPLADGAAVRLCQMAPATGGRPPLPAVEGQSAGMS